MDAAATALINRLIAALPGVPEADIADAITAVLRGEPATLDGRTVSVSIAQDSVLDQATITLGDVAGGHIIKPIIAQPPQPIDPLPAALSTFASIPLMSISRYERY